jgi:peptide deformylase
MPVALVNPQILAASAETEIGSEGCLSVPKLYADVERAVTVLLEATLLDGTPLLVQCGGLLARCLQHEVDHLDGILFPDRAAVGERTALAGKLDAMERRTLKALAKSRQVM